MKPIQLIPVEGIPEIVRASDIAALICGAVAESGGQLEHHDWDAVGPRRGASFALVDGLQHLGDGDDALT